MASDLTPKRIDYVKVCDEIGESARYLQDTRGLCASQNLRLQEQSADNISKYNKLYRNYSSRDYKKDMGNNHLSDTVYTLSSNNLSLRHYAEFLPYLKNPYPDIETKNLDVIDIDRLYLREVLPC